MSRRRRQSIAEDALELLFDLAGLYWQVGALAGVMLLFFSFSTYTWIDEQYVKALSSPHLGQVAQLRLGVLFNTFIDSRHSNNALCEIIPFLPQRTLLRLALSWVPFRYFFISVLVI